MRAGTGQAGFAVLRYFPCADIPLSYDSSLNYFRPLHSYEEKGSTLLPCRRLKCKLFLSG